MFFDFLPKSLAMRARVWYNKNSYEKGGDHMNQQLAEIAREEARKNYHGDTAAALSNLQPLVELFEEAPEVTLASLDKNWSGAFAFLCASRANAGLPIRYPDPRVRASFAEVEAWEDWARLLKIHTWVAFSEVPEIGDLVIFDQIEGKPPKMGIVLSVEDGMMDVAVGNHHNHSAIIEHPTAEGVRGYIRLAAET